MGEKYSSVFPTAQYIFIIWTSLTQLEYFDFSNSDGRDREAAVNVSRHDAHPQVCDKDKNSFLAKLTSSESVIYESFSG